MDYYYYYYTQEGKCSYFDRVRRQFTRASMSTYRVPSTWDLEDIVSFGQHIRVSYSQWCSSGVGRMVQGPPECRPP